MNSPSLNRPIFLSARHFPEWDIGWNAVMRVDVPHASFHAPHLAHIVGSSILHPSVVVAVETALILRRKPSAPSATTVAVSGLSISPVPLVLTMPGPITGVVPVSPMFTMPGGIAIPVPVAILRTVVSQQLQSAG